MLLENGALLNNRYRIIDILGKGGMGSVYRAIDENLGVDVAVKDNLFTTDEYARQFHQEAMILASLRHPNLPRVTDHFVIKGRGQYLVMDYIEGEDLRQRLERIGTISEKELVTIGAAVCDALSYLGSREPPVIHRDIKPGNVKITSQGEIYLVDFGLAKTLVGSQATMTGARAMTPGYSPPEQYGTARTDQRSDIYSLAATLYASISGVTPEDALARAMDQAELTPLCLHNPAIHTKLCESIEKGLAIRPDDRYQDANSFKEALLSFDVQETSLNDQYHISPAPYGDYPIVTGDKNKKEIQAGVVTSLGGDGGNNLYDGVDDHQLGKGRKRNISRSCLAIILVVILIITGLSVWSYYYQPSTYNAAYYTVQSYSSIIYGKFVTSTVPSIIPPSNTITPHYTEAEVLPASKTLTPTIPITASSTPTKSATPTQTETPTYTPTQLGGGGGQIAFVSDKTGTYQIFKVNSDGKKLKQITNMVEGACQPDWSPDGTRLVFISPCKTNTDYYPGSAMFIINEEGTGLTPLPTMIGGDYFPQWSPDGEKIVFTSLRNSKRPQIYILDLKTNNVTALSEKYSFDMQPSWSVDQSQIVFISRHNNIDQIWVMNADGTNKRQFSYGNPVFHYSRPSWSLDMSMILFTQVFSENAVPRVGIAPFGIDEKYVEYFFGQESLPMREAVYSPDGLWLAFESWEGGGSHNIYIIAVTGAGRSAVTDLDGIEFDPAWNPSP